MSSEQWLVDSKAFDLTNHYSLTPNHCLRRNNRLHLQHRLTGRNPFEQAALFKPALWRGRTPQGLALGVAQLPGDRDVVGVDGHVIAVINLEPVSVGVAHVQEKGVTDAVPPRSPLDIVQIARRTHHVEQVG